MEKGVDKWNPSPLSFIRPLPKARGRHPWHPAGSDGDPEVALKLSVLYTSSAVLFGPLSVGFRRASLALVHRYLSHKDGSGSTIMTRED